MKGIALQVNRHRCCNFKLDAKYFSRVKDKGTKQSEEQAEEEEEAEDNEE
jgi:hypothetical protein